MSNVKKRMDQLRKYIEEAGLDFDCFVDKKDSRINARAIAHNGETRLFSLSGGSSDDHRGDMNERSRVRRFAAEVGQPPLMAQKLKPVLEEFKVIGKLAQPKTVEQAAIMDAMDKLPRDIEATKPTQQPSDWLKNDNVAFAATPALSPARDVKDERTDKWVTADNLVLTPKRQQKSLSSKIKTMATTSTDTRKLAMKLTMAESYKLLEYIKALDTEQFFLTSQVTDDVNTNAGLAVRVTDKIVGDTIKALDKKLKDRREGKRSYVQAAPVIARVLVQLMEKMGEPVPDDLRDIAARSLT